MASAGRLATVHLALALAVGIAACVPGGAPRPIAYDREACAHCGMLISEPRFAAQLETADGEIRSFDDPGCLLAELASGLPDARGLWFHHAREERWLDASQVAFEPREPTPMGFGLAAVDAGTPGALSLAEARARVAARQGQSR